MNSKNVNNRGNKNVKTLVRHVCGNVHALSAPLHMLKRSTTAPPPHISAWREIFLMYVLILKLLFKANLFCTEQHEEEVLFFFVRGLRTSE